MLAPKFVDLAHALRVARSQAKALHVAVVPLPHSSTSVVMRLSSNVEHRPGKVGLERFSTGTQVIRFCATSSGVPVGSRQPSGVNISTWRFGLQHGLVRPIQVVEVADQRGDAHTYLRRGSSMWLRTKSVRLPTDFIETV